jgi:hypothetical protein
LKKNQQETYIEGDILEELSHTIMKVKESFGRLSSNWRPWDAKIVVQHSLKAPEPRMQMVVEF